MHHQTGLAEFQKGMAELRKKLDSLDSSEQETKAKLIVANFDSFLAAKQVLDRINSRFLESDETKKQLEQLEQGLQHLKSRTKQQIVPLSEFLQDIKDCVHSTEGVRYVALLLSLNREVTLALLQEDNVQRAVDTIRQQKALILRAQKEQCESQEDSSLAKFLAAFKGTLQKVVARIGQQLELVPIATLEQVGVETF